ncbi:MAG: 3-dehydroquinate synthase [Candidatus Endobugula sp.]|jgi:3-dehydroquinate synthase
MPISQTLIVELSDQRSYPIYIGQGLLSDSACLLSHITGKQVCIVTNETVAPLYLQKVKRLLHEYQLNIVVLPDGEVYKTLDTVNAIYACLLNNRHNRTTTLIALGGGVVGDMTGYAAATYQRGVNFIQIPTTLLSQVDSSVGGKTGVNHPLGKNMIGAFHQPQCVIIDTDALHTLPQRELSSGMAEVIKYGLIGDHQFYLWIEANIAELMSLNEGVIIEAIARSCQNKADIVTMDEREGGIRAILNLGHTFGHAIETAQGYGVWLHGEAVAVGMLVALKLSALLGHITMNEVNQLRRLLSDANLPLELPADMSADQFLGLMSLDKKVLDGKLRLVLLESIGRALVTDQVPLNQVIKAIEDCAEVA